jgi:ribosome-binding ATPase YchF (GTP1/OBG family)
MKMYEMIEARKEILYLIDKEELEEQDLKDLDEFILSELQEKGKGLIFVNSEFETELEKIKRLENMLKDRKRVISNNQSRFKEKIKYTMQELDIKSVKTEFGNITLRKGVESLTVEDGAKVPSQFEIVKVEIDKKQLKEAVKKGLEVDGIYLKTGDNSVVMPKGVKSE